MENEELEYIFSEEETQSKMRKERTNGLLLSDYQIDILNRNHINYESMTSMNQLLFQVEEILNNDELLDDELEIISQEIAELAYYKDTNK